MKDKTIGEAEVIEKFGVAPDRVIDVQALAGDSTDNIPGVQGIGIKTAAELINTYGDLDTLLERAEEIKQPKRRERLIEQADMARISRQLVTLKTDLDLEFPLDDFKTRKPDPEKLLAFLHEQEFKSLVQQIAAKHDVDPNAYADEDMTDADNDTSVEAQYTTIQKMDDLKPWIEKAAAAPVIAIDTETDDLNSMRAGLVGISLSIEPGKACYIPVAHVGSGSQGSFDLGDGGSDGRCTGRLQANFGKSWHPEGWAKHQIRPAGFGQIWDQCRAHR
jgi:DNA polymerase-1